MSDAASRAAARKARIQARGNTGLAKLAQSARGEEAQALYADDFKPSPSSTPQTETPPPIPSSNTSTSTSEKSNPSWAPPPPSSSTSSRANPNLTAEQQAMSSQLEAMMSMFGGGPPGAGADGELPDMSKLLQSMMGGIDPSQSGQRLLGDLDDPAGLGGSSAAGGLGGIPPNLFGGGGDGQNGDMPFPFPGMAGLGGLGGQTKKTKSEKYFPLIHFISIVVLSIFTIIWWEPKIKKETSMITALEGGWVKRWSGLGQRGIGKFGNVEVVPIFWAFTTLELILQTSRFMIFKSPPPPHSLISNFLPLLPPKISRPILTISRYLSLILQTYKDGCLLVFMMGMTVVVSQWLDGGKVF
ncbi:hypothetical protein I302_100757 [Kwoniella bestiolae CBS 10118]|uniref:Golgi to ER traffic protein 2 n=1 Tax=Kwoniella bestiolae CBS 10118 TaxID=1296100 RepID=A0A1B9G5Z2_9TREE|nr:hypothetical protein I302_04130 [Kwoniella bestiolae CBS 10118]OCF26445.1 hypothetical protein I302_04130 [Kwoniella bestiolae CBS 10118]